MNIELGEAFENSAAANPFGVALIDSAGSLTYGVLRQLARQIADRVDDCLSGRDEPVAVMIDRNRLSVAAVLGVILSGRAYVPIAKAWPLERREFLLADAGVPLFIDACGEELTFRTIDRDAAAQAVPSEIAYILYTSGSTGPPKGCLVTHRNVMSLFNSTQEFFSPSPHDICSVAHSLAFDVSVWEIWGAWLYGAAVWLASAEEIADPDVLADKIARVGVTRFSATPTLFSFICDALERKSVRLPRLRSVVLAGEAVNLGDVRRFINGRFAPRARVVNMYGITETTIHVTFRPLTGEEVPARNGATPIGEAIPGMRIDLRDADSGPVPTGQQGEMWISGDGVSDGYYRRPELSRDRFVTDDAGQRWYKSGDLAFYDGEYHYVGRFDRQVQFRGFRIELGEIEAVLESAEGVGKAVAVIEMRPGSQLPALVAYVSPQAGSDLPKAGDLRARLRASLPIHAVPQAIRYVDAFPVNANGKLDLQAIAEIGRAAGQRGVT